MSYLLRAVKTKNDVDTVIRDILDKIVVIRFGRSSDSACMKLDEILMKSSRDVSNFAEIFVADADAPELQVYVKYFDITFLPATLFFFNAEHMKMDYGTQDHTKFIGAFSSRQDFIDVVEVLFRGAMHGKYIVPCPLPPERIPKYDLIYKDI
eukprot:jgi/Mesvir1/6543/Mv16804-RA.1